MSDLVMYFVYWAANFLVFFCPLILLHKTIVYIIGPSDILNGVFAVFAIGLLWLIRRISLQQIDPKVGFFGGIKLGLIEFKGYLSLFLGK